MRAAGLAPGQLRPGNLRDPVVFLASGFGSGFLRPAPGTWGTLVALGLWWWLLAAAPWWWQLAAAVGITVVGVWLAALLARRYRLEDDPAIVVDEFAGLWIALVAAPAIPEVAFAGFLLFRVFDVIKPWPVSWADRRHGAVGVMLDDVFAGGLAAVVLQLAILSIAWPPLRVGP